MAEEQALFELGQRVRFSAYWLGPSDRRGKIVSIIPRDEQPDYQLQLDNGHSIVISEQLLSPIQENESVQEAAKEG